MYRRIGPFLRARYYSVFPVDAILPKIPTFLDTRIDSRY